MTPLTGIRDKLEISKSPELCLYANYVISGQLIVEQGGKSTTANEGDLVLYDSTLPVKHIKIGDRPFEDLSFSIPKNQIASEGRIFENLAIPETKIIAPLAASLQFLSQNISSSLSDELDALGHACATLLSAVPYHHINQHGFEVFALMPNHRAQEMMRYIDANLDSSELSPTEVAEHLGISVRYVHKQFASFGTTFGNYLRSKRLEHISADLVSDVGRHQPIGNLAYRWGFNDLSTFNRAFKKKFGCLPREYRAKFW
jgi:AraC-like DNA-binding protein